MEKGKSLKWPLLGFLIIFAIISVVTIKSAMTYLSPDLGNLAVKQITWYGFGFFLMGILYFFPKERLYRLVWYFYLIGNLLLLGLLFFGTPINDSKCWYILPGIGSFQPSEFMKVILMLVLGVMIKKWQEKSPHPSVKEELFFLIKVFIVVLIPSILTFLEPDTGVVMIYLVITGIMLFTAGLRLRWFFLLGGLLIAGLGSILGLYFLKEDLFIQLFGTDLFYRLERLFAWQTGTGLQLENAMAAIGSAGLFGHGFNKTPIYFPESGTDFIFAVFASNFGLIGSLILVLLFVLFDFYLLYLAKREKDTVTRSILYGIFAMILFQQVQNIGMTIGLLPITGITLPFISYGGSSLLSYLLMIGLLFHPAKKKQTLSYGA